VGLKKRRRRTAQSLRDCVPDVLASDLSKWTTRDRPAEQVCLGGKVDGDVPPMAAKTVA
jgi:hypothetical protein